jgi:hypothetical protein
MVTSRWKIDGQRLARKPGHSSKADESAQRGHMRLRRGLSLPGGIHGPVSLFPQVGGAALGVTLEVALCRHHPGEQQVGELF